MTTGNTRSPSVRPADKMVRPLATVPGSPAPKAEPLVSRSKTRTKIARPSMP